MTGSHKQVHTDSRGVPVTPPRTRSRIFWWDARHCTQQSDVLMAAQHQGFDRWVVNAQDVESFRSRSANLGWVIAVENPSQRSALQDGDVALSTDDSLLRSLRGDGIRTALVVKVHDAVSLRRSHELGASHDFVVLELVDETNIPLELVVAELQQQPTLVLKWVTTAQAADVSFGVVEHGADGAVFVTGDVQEITRIGELKQRQERYNLRLVSGVITHTQHLGMGHRACVDVTSLMTQQEGMIVGSTSSGGLLACSETHPLPYMDLRPFRVNAGAIHSYLWCPNHRTHYLSELTVGSVVQCVDIHGQARPVTVGRVKTEVRPLILLAYECEGISLNTIMQDDWHVRVFGADGKPVSVTTLVPGSSVLCYLTTPGRHVGIAVDEQIIER